MDLRLRSRPVGPSEATVVEVAGELDLHAAPGLRAELARATETSAPRVAVDLTGVTFIDSTGVGVLVGALKRARAAQGELTFCGAGARVKRVFEITGLIGALPLFATRDEAVAALILPPQTDADNGNAETDADNGNGDADNGDADNGDADNGDADNGDADNGDADNGDADNGDAAPLILDSRDA